MRAIDSQETTAEVWEFLRRRHENLIKACELAIRRELLNLRMRRGETMEDYFASAEAMGDELTDNGEDISDEDYKVYLMAVSSDP